MPRRGARSAFGTENAINLRVEFQAKARKILAEVDRLNKEERDQVQRGLDLNLIASLPHTGSVPLSQKQPTAPCVPQAYGLTGPSDGEDAGPRRRQRRAAAVAARYTESLSPRQRKTAMLPPSPRRRQSARTAQRNIDTAQARAAELAAVASASHAAAEGAPAVNIAPALRTRSQTRSTVHLSPGQLSPGPSLCSGPQDLLTPIKKSSLQDAQCGPHDHPAAEALLSPALQAVCNGLDLGKLDSDALALSPINHGLSPLTLSLTDLPSPLNALPALVSPCPDALQSPTVLPCLPLTPKKVSELEMTPDAHLCPASLRLLSKPSGDQLSNSLRRRAAVTRALAESFLQSPRDAQMINVRDLGSFASPRDAGQL